MNDGYHFTRTTNNPWITSDFLDVSLEVKWLVNLNGVFQLRIHACIPWGYNPTDSTLLTNFERDILVKLESCVPNSVFRSIFQGSKNPLLGTFGISLRISSGWYRIPPWHEVCFVAGNEFAHQHKGGMGLRLESKTPKNHQQFQVIGVTGTPPIIIGWEPPFYVLEMFIEKNIQRQFQQLHWVAL